MAAPAQRAKQLEDSLSELEGILEPLFEKKLHESLEKLDTLNQAKLCVMIPYVVNQLVTAYLRAKGMAPEKPYVEDELSRIKDHFHKVSRAQGAEATTETDLSEPKMQLDKDAANRFIKAALAEASKAEKEEMQRLGIDAPTQSSTTTWVPRERGPEDQQPVMEGGMHTRFAHIQRIQEESGSSSSSEEDAPPKRPVASKPEAGNKKRKRFTMDPFTGYTEQLSKKSRKTANSMGRAKPEQEQVALGAEAVPTPHSDEPTLSKKARKKARKKAKRRDTSNLLETSAAMDSDQ
ncbi:SubName: Full=Uncharacterized protein {ECO:0000313/EMBL:CCA68740.1} [Serendipita indica DSM 11827]|nr:SubName: Full=Uncharacterized protein {ECO:0000313/EMBL:CCA68740.1} [Serendipita indica DSM 11827]